MRRTSKVRKTFYSHILRWASSWSATLFLSFKSTSLAVLAFSFFDRCGQERMQHIDIVMSLTDDNTLFSVVSFTDELSMKGSGRFYQDSIVYRIWSLASLSYSTSIFSNGERFIHYLASSWCASTFTVVNNEMNYSLIAKISRTMLLSFAFIVATL